MEGRWVCMTSCSRRYRWVMMCHSARMAAKGKEPGQRQPRGRGCFLATLVVGAVMFIIDTEEEEEEKRLMSCKEKEPASKQSNADAISHRVCRIVPFFLL